MTQILPSDGNTELAALIELQQQRRQELGIVEKPQSVPAGPLLADACARLLSIPPPTQAELDAQERRRLQAIVDQKTDKWNRLCAARGSRYRDCRLETFQCATRDQTAVVQELKLHAGALRIESRHWQNVIFLGPPGTGKDHLMMGLAHAGIDAGMSPKWCQGQELWAEFRDAIDHGDTERSIIDRYAHAGVLMLSDPLPPRGPVSDFQAVTLFRIIDARYSNLRPTWVTLNVASRSEAEERLGPQVIDRLSQDALVIACNWPSFRTKKA